MYVDDYTTSLSIQLLFIKFASLNVTFGALTVPDWCFCPLSGVYYLFLSNFIDLFLLFQIIDPTLSNLTPTNWWVLGMADAVPNHSALQQHCPSFLTRQVQ